MEISIALILVIVLALAFDFTNGFHDTANSIATLVGTRALDPKKAVLLAAVMNFIGAFWSLEVAATVGKGIIDPSFASLEVVLAGLCGAITWNVVTWFFGLPSSSSHALIGGLVGAALAAVGPNGIFWSGVIQKVAIPAVLAPLLGLLGAGLVMAILMRTFRTARPGPANRGFRYAQLASGAWLSFTHGTNDAQKTMGIIGLALFTASGSTNSDDFGIPFWVVLSAATAIALGTYMGGWRIIKTLGGRVVKMSPIQGFSASSAAASVLYLTQMFGIPVSTTHCVSGCIMGAGASKRLSSVRWQVAGDIVSAWVLTLPCAAIVGAAAYAITAISPLLLVGILITGLVFLRHKMATGEMTAAH